MKSLKPKHLIIAVWKKIIGCWVANTHEDMWFMSRQKQGWCSKFLSFPQIFMEIEKYTPFYSASSSYSAEKDHLGVFWTVLWAKLHCKYKISSVVKPEIFINISSKVCFLTKYLIQQEFAKSSGEKVTDKASRGFCWKHCTWFFFKGRCHIQLEIKDIYWKLNAILLELNSISPFLMQ